MRVGFVVDSAPVGKGVVHGELLLKVLDFFLVLPAAFGDVGLQGFDGAVEVNNQLGVGEASIHDLEESGEEPEKTEKSGSKN